MDWKCAKIGKKTSILEIVIVEIQAFSGVHQSWNDKLFANPSQHSGNHLFSIIFNSFFLASNSFPLRISSKTISYDKNSSLWLNLKTKKIEGRKGELLENNILYHALYDNYKIHTFYEYDNYKILVHWSFEKETEVLVSFFHSNLKFPDLFIWQQQLLNSPGVNTQKP